MNLFQFRRGDFLGIIIPGAFLLTNIVLLIGKMVELNLFEDSFDITKNTAAVYAIMFIFSYIFGIILRLIKPEYMEKMPPVSMASFKDYPYIDWYFDEYKEAQPDSIVSFYKDFLENEYGGVRSRLRGYKGKDFINFCKSFVIHKSDALRDDILYSEGLVRMISGMSWALFLSVIILTGRTILVAIEGQSIILPIIIIVLYLLGTLYFKSKIRRIRTKEVANILDSFALLKSKWMK